MDLLAANSDVVIDDIGFIGAPYDQSSDVSTNTAEELGRAAPTGGGAPRPSVRQPSSA